MNDSLLHQQQPQHSQQTQQEHHRAHDSHAVQASPAPLSHHQASEASSLYDTEVEQLTRFRRDLHRIPELGFELPKTIAYVTHTLEDVREILLSNYGAAACTVFSPCKSTVCAFFNRESEYTTAIRSDMDALPVTETTMLPFASQHDGQMHACGHDGHMSMVLGLARWLAAHFEELPRNVLLVFQPAEETTGGARVVCESGVFERYNVDRIFGFHLWPDLPAGQIASRPGALLAAANEVTATFHGKSSHIAKADDGADALEACMRFYQDAYAYIAQREKEEPCLLKFGHMEAGTVRNAIAGHAVLEGSLRTFSVEMGKRCRHELSELAQKHAKEMGCICELYFSEGYPPVVNDARLYEMTLEALTESGMEQGQMPTRENAVETQAQSDATQEKAPLNKNITEIKLASNTSENAPDTSFSVHEALPALPNPAPLLAPTELPEPLLIAEDFAFYQQHLPGVFLLLGTGTGIPLHADTFNFDESILQQGLNAYKALVMMK